MSTTHLHVTIRSFNVAEKPRDGYTILCVLSVIVGLPVIHAAKRAFFSDVFMRQSIAVSFIISAGRAIALTLAVYRTVFG